MDRTIAVKGTARLSLAPDTIEVNLNLSTLEKQYADAVGKSAAQLEELQGCLAALGFENKDLKTVYYNVSAEYEYRNDKNGNGRRVFTGYRVNHNLRLDMPYDTERMSKVLAALAGSKTDPDFSLNFTVKDRDAVKDELLIQAAENARHKAEVLTKASGCRLGQLLSVSYNWSDMSFYSPTNYGMDRKCMAMGAAVECEMDISPDNIEVSDNASFVYEII